MLQIYASSNKGNLVNRLGKYLNKNIDGAFKIEFKPMECIVTMRMYYQIPSIPDSLDEMHFIINITSYDNKLRVNITEDTEFEKTIGQVILSDFELTDFELARKKILTKLNHAIQKEYAEFDFVY